MKSKWIADFYVGTSFTFDQVSYLEKNEKALVVGLIITCPFATNAFYEGMRSFLSSFHNYWFLSLVLTGVIIGNFLWDCYYT